MRILSLRCFPDSRGSRTRRYSSLCNLSISFCRCDGLVLLEPMSQNFRQHAYTFSSNLHMTCRTRAISSGSHISPAAPMTRQSLSSIWACIDTIETLATCDELLSPVPSEFPNEESKHSSGSFVLRAVAEVCLIITEDLDSKPE